MAGGIKRTRADALFSQLVRERAGWACECCGREYPEGSSRQGLHCSHIYSRRHKATRHHPDNAVAHCYSCHQRLGGDPVEFARWAENHLGADRLEDVGRLARSVFKTRKNYQTELAKHLKLELDDMLSQRRDGVTGRLEFAGYDAAGDQCA